jgi:hypothetical protein
MPILVALDFALQIFFAVHAYRSGRAQFWLYIILIFPFMGWFIYFLVEFLPDMFNSAGGRAAQAKFRKALNPEKEYREAQYAVQTTPTVENRIRFAQALMQRREYDAVIALLQPALTNHFADDPLLLEGLAYAYYYKGDLANAALTIQKIYADETRKPKDYIRLLRARVLQDGGDLQAAREELSALIPIFTGEEARITLAQLHERMGNKPAAQALYEDVVKRARHAPAHYKKQQREWIEMAKAALARG